MEASGQNRIIVVTPPTLSGWLSPTPVRAFTRAATCTAFVSISLHVRFWYVARATFDATMGMGLEAQLVSRSNNSKGLLRKAQLPLITAPRARSLTCIMVHRR